MEAPSSKRFAVLVTRCILVACLIQSNYAEVCYLRSHRGYGGCIRWFLPADISNCTAIKLGGYTPMFYKRSQIIELDQPFISEDYEEVQGFLKNQVPSLATTHVTKMAEDSRKSVTTGEGVSDQSETATVSTPTAKLSEATSDVKAVATNTFKYVTTGDSASDQATTVSEPIPDIDCPPNMGKGRLNCTGSKTIECNDNTRYCSKASDGTVEILICGCNGTNTSTFIPMGFSYVNGTRECYCNADGTTVCSDNDGHMEDSSMCNINNKVEIESGTCQIGNNGHQTYSRLPRSRPSDCHDLYEDGIRESGVYCVYPNNRNNASEPHLNVFCNMGFPRGGWTVIQRRVNGSVDFNRNWTEYKNGFGELNHEFWLGNENIYHLTNQKNMQLRIDMTNDNGDYYVIYSMFRIGNETTGYKLLELGMFQSNSIEVKNSFTNHVNALFSTKDNDNDLHPSENCAMTNSGGWWFTSCQTCHLNGVYGEFRSPGIRWYHLPGGQYNIKSTEMKIRPA